MNRLEVMLADPAAAHERNAESFLRAHSEILLNRSPSCLYRVPQTLHESGFLSGNRSPHRHIQPTRRAGTPTISAYAATSFVTTLPAPMNAYSSRVMPQTIVALAPIVAPRRTSVRLYSFFLEMCARGLTTLVKTIDGPQKTSSSSSTPSYTETLF